MTELTYQSSAYGNPWEDRKTGPLSLLEKYQSKFFLYMMPERHHRIINKETSEVVWFHRSSIAPEPGSKHDVSA